MNVRLIAQASEDVDTAHDWYESQKPGLGDEFLDALDRIVHAIGQAPRLFPRVESVGSQREIRQRSVEPFSYLVYYEILADEVVVLSVAHKSRGTKPWLKRKP